MNDNGNKDTPLEDIQAVKDQTKDQIANLTAREPKALRLKFGANIAQDVNLEEIGRQFDVTRQRIREIEAKALDKLNNKKTTPSI
jgi:RNA polymerase primary sigma factor